MNDCVVTMRRVMRRFQMGDTPAVDVLRGVDLDVARGESLAIIGPSGSGKTTLLQLIGALDYPDAGTVSFEGRDLGGLGEAERGALRSRRIGFVFQLHHLLPQLTVLENVLVPAWATGDAADGLDRALGLLERVGLRDRRDHRPAQLSGGERQRAALVRALVLKPALLLADEPTGSLDYAGASSLADLLVELNRDEGVTLIAVTHSRDFAARMSRCLKLQDGVLRAVPVHEP
jgi:lipoprotein-releasing system ATP-binding protein